MPESLTLTSPSELAAALEGSAQGLEDAELVHAAKSGDEAAFGRLVRRHEKRVFRLVGRFFRHPEDIDDVAQEVFLRIWSKLSTYRARAPFEHWLTRVCLNVCYQRLRRTSPATLPLERAELVPAVSSSSPDAGVDVARWLARLDPRDRFILLLLDGEGWSTAEIAERLGWSRVNVKVRAHRARQRLRRWLEEGTRS